MRCYRSLLCTEHFNIVFCIGVHYVVVPSLARLGIVLGDNSVVADCYSYWRKVPRFTLSSLKSSVVTFSTLRKSLMCTKSSLATFRVDIGLVDCGNLRSRWPLLQLANELLKCHIRRLKTTYV